MRNVEREKVTFEKKYSQVDLEKAKMVQSSGKRKKSHALCYIRPGIGRVTVNRRKYFDYFPSGFHRLMVLRAMALANVNIFFLFIYFLVLLRI